MDGFGLLRTVNLALPYVEGVLALVALILLGKKRAWGQYKSLAAILIIILWWSAFSLLVFHLYHPANRRLVYAIYFYSYWSSLIINAILMSIFCYGILTRLFSSSPKLQSISARIFWGIVLLWSATSARLFFNPHVNGWRLLAAEATRLQVFGAEVSFLAAVVIFVCIRPLGLQLQSPLPAFGLGLIFSAMIVFSYDLFRNSPQHYSWIGILGGVAICAQLISWVAAISWSEPARQIVSV